MDRAPTAPVAVGAQQTMIGCSAESLAPAFRRERALVCRDFFDASLLAALLGSIARSKFVDDRVERLGTREIEAPQRVGGAISLMLNRAPFLRWIEAVTGCGPIARADGRVVQTRANARDSLDWHDDMNEKGRRLGITICLSDSAFEGGWFELRDASTGTMLMRHRHEQAGTALIFEVSPQLQHRLTPVTEGASRRVYAGWFLGDGGA